MEINRSNQIGSLPPHLVQKAADELNEVPTRRMKDIQALREMFKDEPHLKADLSDEFLLRFLRARKFNRDRAFKLITKYYKIKFNNPSLFGELLPSKSEELLNANMLDVLPYKDDQERTIAVFRSDRWDVYNYSLESITRVALLSFEAAIHDETLQVCGVVLILDLDSFGLRHLQHIRPGIVAKLMSLVQDSIPLRIKGVHIVREPVFVDIAYTIFKPFLTSKLKKRIHFHGSDMSSLHRHIPPENLPYEYDGFRGPIDNSHWPKKVLENEGNVQRSLQYGYKDL